MKFLISILTAFVLISSSLFVQAQNQTFPLANQERPAITESMVQNVLNSFRSLKAEFKGHSTAKAINNQIQASNSLEKVNRIVQKHGYKNFMDWQSDVMAVALTYGAYRKKIDNPQQSEIQAQINKILNNPNLSPAQKESMVKMIKAASTMVSKMANASDQEIAIIKKHENEIKALFND